MQQRRHSIMARLFKASLVAACVRATLAAAALAVGCVLLPSTLSAAPCSNAAAIGLARTIEIDTSAGPIFGTLTRQAREPSFLQEKEVVLTFDDGPMPWVTKSILDTLDAHCTKATFFSVGKMALAYPATVQDTLARGHTVGTHTYSHPFNMPRMKLDSAISEIERGFAGVATAAGGGIAPFFRFTGLSDSARLMAYLQTRGIAAFTVDVVSNDSYINDPQKLIERTMAEITRNKGGIVLFHDIKTSTAKALPQILAKLQAQGYSVVHITAKMPVEPVADAMRDVAPKLAKAGNGMAGGKTLLPFYGAVGPEKLREGDAGQVTALAPAARDRTASIAPPNAAAQNTKAGQIYAAAPARPLSAKTKSAAGDTATSAAGWLKQSVIETNGGRDVIAADAVLSPAGGWATEILPKGTLKPTKSSR